MKHINEEQLAYIRRGIQEEVEKDVRIHKGMALETQNLLNQYSSLMEEEKPNWIAAATIPAALIDCFDFWKIYFDESPEAAFAFHQDREIKMRKENSDFVQKLA